MQKSAGVFSVPFDAAAAMTALEGAIVNSTGLQRVRLQLDEDGKYSAISAPLPPAPDSWHYVISSRRVNGADALARHKTTWRELYDDEHARCGVDEVLFLNTRGELAEGSRTNIFVRRDGKFLTPPLSAGALNGVLRRELLDTGECEEAILTLADLEHQVFLGNSLRGLIPAQLDARRQCAE